MAHTADLELTAEELRVLGALIEKERATPDQYPLTTNALRTSCNQKSSRDPVVDYGQSEVEAAMLSLRDKGYARTVTGSGRTVKHKQVLDEALGLSNGEVSLLGVLMLRGAQTPNELRTRTDRLHGFEDNASVERTLATMAAGQPSLVRCIGREPGQREDRWVHLLAGEDNAPAGVAGGASAPKPGLPGPTEPILDAPAPLGSPAASPHHAEPAVVASASAPPSPPASAPTPTLVPTGQPSEDAARIAELEAEVADLRAEVDRLRDRFDDLASQLGMSPS
ncbi:MAG: YceH family protein [Acidimicrobiales bacterium]